MKVKRTTFKYRNLIGNDMALKFKNTAPGVAILID